MDAERWTQKHAQERLAEAYESPREMYDWLQRSIAEAPCDPEADDFRRYVLGAAAAKCLEEDTEEALEADPTLAVPDDDWQQVRLALALTVSVADEGYETRRADEVEAAVTQMGSILRSAYILGRQQGRRDAAY